MQPNHRAFPVSTVTPGDIAMPGSILVGCSRTLVLVLDFSGTVFMEELDDAKDSDIKGSLSKLQGH